MSVLDYIRTLQRHWVLILLLGFAGGAVGYVAALGTPDTYSATSTVLITSDAGSSAGELVQGSTFVHNQVASYVLLTTSQMVLEPVIMDLGLDTTVTALARTVVATSPLNTSAIQISATSGSASLAQRVASATADSLANSVASISQRDEKGVSTTRVTTIQEATLPVFAVGPIKRNWVFFGGLFGGVVAVGIALVRGLVGRPVVQASDVASITETPVLGEIVEAPRGVTLTQGVLRDPLSLEAESVRRLATNLSFVTVDGGLRSLVITSASSGESKSHLSTSLAIALAETSRRVLLIDADLRSPSIGEITQLDEGVGLTSVLIGEQRLTEAVQKWRLTGLNVLTAGPRPPNPGQLLSTKAMHSLISQAAEEYDMVIVDSPPLLHVADATWLGHMTDGAILVARRNHTTTRSLANAIGLLHTAKVPLLGVVIGRTPRANRKRYGEAFAPVGDASTDRLMKN